MTNPLTDLIAAISGASLCWRCIAVKTGLTPAQLDEAMMEARRRVTIALVNESCDACRSVTLLYSVSRVDP